MHDPQEWITRLNMSGKPLSKGQKRIAEYISCHYEKAVSMTAVMLGRQCGVSESTVVRFAMALGYEGYPEMQEKLRSMVRQRLTAEQRVGMMEETDRREVVSTVLKNDLQNLRKTMDELHPQDFDMAVECILAARRLYIMGLRSSAPLAMFLYHYLHQIFDEVVLVQNLTGDVFEEIDRIQKGDVLFGISFPRYSKRTVKAIDYAMEHTGAEAFNLGTGHGYSVLDIVKAFEKVNGVKVPYKIEARRPGDIAECWANPAKARELLGWTAQKNLEDMCRDAWRWQTQNPNGYAD
mgnify:CR=1 FL=1